MFFISIKTKLSCVYRVYGHPTINYPSTMSKPNNWTPEGLCESSPEPTPKPKNTYPVMQVNGQRIYKQPSIIGTTAKPPKGTEVFVGNLPRNLFEDELIPLFSQIGEVYSLRLMMDFSGLTRGFAFVAFWTRQHAEAAVKRFDNYQIRKSAFITVHKSVDNCRLFFGNIPREVTEEVIREELDEILEGVEGIILYNDVDNPGLNRGFAFVEFEDHGKAAIARRKMLAGIVTLWGVPQVKVFVDWAEPEPVVDPQVLEQVTVIFMTNVPGDYSSNYLKRIMISILGDFNGLTRVYKRNNYAFVHFESRALAELAFEELNSRPLIFNERLIKIEWARPAAYSKRYAEQVPPKNFCMSVPPRTRRRIEKIKQTKKNGQKISGSISSQEESSGESVNAVLESREDQVDFIAAELRKLEFL